MEKSKFLKPATLLPIVAAVLLMGVSAYYQGIWSERWGEFPELKIYSDQLHQVPLKIGEWEGKDIGESSERIKEISGAQGEFNRVYRNAAGEEVRVMLMCARFRDIFYHSPDLCYPAAGFEMLNPPQQEVIDDAEFFTTTFRKSDPVTGTHDERGYWTWTSDGKWLAPKNERLTFSGERALYKMYIFGTVPASEQGRTEKDFIADFIRQFMPAATTALRPGFEKAKLAREGEEVAAAAPAPPAKAEAAPAAK
jgi:hypothetical protein